MTLRRLAAAAMIVPALALAACGKKKAEPVAGPEALAPADWADLRAVLKTPDGKETGEVLFADAEEGVLMRIRVAGLSPGWHGVHFHQVADCSDGAAGFKASGPHVDPDDHAHGLKQPQGSERGDLPNIWAGADGRATAEIFRWGVTLRPSEAAAARGAHALIDDDGFAVIVHANADDQITQPIGGAGDRVACAAIGP